MNDLSTFADASLNLNLNPNPNLSTRAPEHPENPENRLCG